MLGVVSLPIHYSITIRCLDPPFCTKGLGTSTIGQHSFGWNESMSAAALAVGEALTPTTVNLVKW